MQITIQLASIFTAHACASSRSPYITRSSFSINSSIRFGLEAPIISDTLLFRSPTCTPLDERTAKKLAKISDIDLEQMAQEMFNAGSNLKGKSAEDICFQDFKQFTVNDTIFGVGQITSMSKEELAAIRDMMTEHLPKVLEAHNLNMIYFMLTDILAESTELLSSGSLQILRFP